MKRNEILPRHSKILSPNLRIPRPLCKCGRPKASGNSQSANRHGSPPHRHAVHRSAGTPRTPRAGLPRGITARFYLPRFATRRRISKSILATRLRPSYHHYQAETTLIFQTRPQQEKRGAERRKAHPTNVRAGAGKRTQIAHFVCLRGSALLRGALAFRRSTCGFALRRDCRRRASTPAALPGTVT